MRVVFLRGVGVLEDVVLMSSISRSSKSIWTCIKSSLGLQHMEEHELEEELHAMDEEMEDAEPRQRRNKK
uniref:Uncharacterized protein n=1 Tax=Medicago truncatula TaxID=3880 RepID=A2Q4P9_MEDTR|nr:hypothetical protein MtrDRAFT_AC157507g8v2 [Medicago truncatula]